MNKTLYKIISVVESDQVGIIAKVTTALSEHKINVMHEQAFNAMHHI